MWNPFMGKCCPTELTRKLSGCVSVCSPIGCQVTWPNGALHYWPLCTVGTGLEKHLEPERAPSSFTSMRDPLWKKLKIVPHGKGELF